MTPSATDILLRLGCAVIAGLIVGWERETHGRPAGLRTTMLACVASATAVIVSEFLMALSADTTFATVVRADPARIPAGIVTGFGFLGAGTIIRQDNFVRGLTTAATLWFSTILGLAFGAGLFYLGLVGVGIAILTLVAVPLFEKKLPSDEYVTLSVTCRLETLSESDLATRIKTAGMKILRMSLKYDLPAQEKTVVCKLRLKSSNFMPASQSLAADLVRTTGVVRFEWA